MQTAVTTVANTAVLVRKGGLGASDVVISVLLCVLYLCHVFSGKRILGQYSENKDIFSCLFSLLILGVFWFPYLLRLFVPL